MAETALGFLLRRLREDRGLSLRELGQLASVDHAYIHRLENGDKESPSEDVLTRLIRGLKAGKREAEMLRYLASHGETRADLVAHVMADPTVTFQEFTAVAITNFRGTVRPDYAKQIERIRRILADQNGNG